MSKKKDILEIVKEIAPRKPNIPPELLEDAHKLFEARRKEKVESGGRTQFSIRLMVSALKTKYGEDAIGRTSVERLLREWESKNG